MVRTADPTGYGLRVDRGPPDDGFNSGDAGFGGLRCRFLPYGWYYDQGRRYARSKEVYLILRPETHSDCVAVREVNILAFQDHPYSRQTAHLIVAALRAADALALSLVAESGGEVVGHIAFSAAAIGGAATGWFLLGPVAVQPARQGEGIGRALVETGLDALRSRGARWGVLVGAPAFYGRFGFRQSPGVVWPCVPDENVLCLLLSGEMPTGEVAHHPAFPAGTWAGGDARRAAGKPIGWGFSHALERLS